MGKSLASGREPGREQWLVRTSKNIISGPFSREEVIQKIQQQELSLQDEVCRANHYWIYLHEREEVQNQLGIEVPRPAPAPGDDEEITQTRSEYSEPASSEQLPEPELADVPEAFEALEAGSSMAPRTASPMELAPSSVPLEAPSRSSLQNQCGSQVEKSSFFQGFAWVLITVAGLLIFLVLKLLRQSGG